MNMGWFIQDAYAQAEATSDTFLSLLPLVLIFGVFYFLLIRPQNKRQKEHKELVANIAVGDEVATAGGVLGTVTAVKDQFVHVQVADGVELKIQRHTVGSVMPKGTVKSA
jgi:preprotein translocase subunit YajC